MAPASRVASIPLPAWGPADLAAAVAEHGVAVLDGIQGGCLVGWGRGPATADLGEAFALAGRAAPGPSIPDLLGAAVGRLNWDGSARYWVPGNAALFDPASGRLWVRGELPAGGRALGPAGADFAALPERLTLAEALWPAPQFCAAVRQAQERMAAGALQKVILSVPFRAPCAMAPVTVYRWLTAGSPPGLRFLIDEGQGPGALIGVSPEPLVRLAGRRAELHLLAGTRRDEPGLDRELQHSKKDQNEHSIAVEQARQDLLSVCHPASVAVDRFMEIERHPGLIHLASHLSGFLNGGRSPTDLLRACFPASTVGGVPREPALRAIAELEPTPREWYAGGVGAVLPGGGLDLWITIRSLHLSRGIAEVRTGAGLVAESDPMAEFRECQSKARRPLAAVGAEVHADE